MPNTIKPTFSQEIEALAERAPDAVAKKKLLELAEILRDRSDPDATEVQAMKPSSKTRSRA